MTGGSGASSSNRRPRLAGEERRPEPRRRLSPEERRRQLLEHGLQAFTARPYGEVTVADVAKEAGVSEALVFSYFGDKETFYRESILAGLAFASAASDPDPGLGARERFRTGLDGYVRLVERFPLAIPHVNQGGPAADPEIQAAVERARGKVVDRVVGRIGIPDPPQDLRRATRLWLTFVETSTVEWVNRRDVDRDELLEEQIVVFRSLVTRVLGLPADPRPESLGPPLIP